MQVEQITLNMLGQAILNAWAGISRTGIECDMCLCDREILHPWLAKLHIMGRDLVLCPPCWEKLSPSLSFLILGIGMEIPFSVSMPTCKEFLED